ncbi:MAG: YchJ family protein [Methylococcus sp.]|nr:YchJ family protein [Methylococcus sp.]
MNDASSRCPCGGSSSYADCCAAFHTGLRPAPTAEALMRSRYSAYVLKNAAYLIATWHPDTRPAAMELDTDTTRWIGLDVLHTAKGSPLDADGEVEFQAHYLAGSRRGCLHEISRFVRERDAWVYLDGYIQPDSGETPVGRNEPCPCGSGKKFKHCCSR